MVNPNAPDFAPQISEHFWWVKRDDTILDLRTDSSRPADYEEVMIDVFEDRTRYWILKPLRRLLRQSAGNPTPEDFLVFTQLLLYVEAIERWHKGAECPNGQAGVWFKASAARILGLLSCNATCTLRAPCGIDVCRLWTDGRNQLAHAGMTYSRVLLSRGGTLPVSTRDDYLIVDAVRFLDLVEGDFENYMARLRDTSSSERPLFLKLWRKRWAQT